jgi:hypothetical protein
VVQVQTATALRDQPLVPGHLDVLVVDHQVGRVQDDAPAYCSPPPSSPSSPVSTRPTPPPPRAPPQQPETRSPAPAGSYVSKPDINYPGQPYVKHASVGSVRHLPDYICGAGSALAGVP